MDFLSLWFVLPAFFGAAIAMGCVGAIVDYWTSSPVDVRTEIHKNRAVEAYYCGSAPRIVDIAYDAQTQDRLSQNEMVESWDWTINRN